MARLLSHCRCSPLGIVQQLPVSGILRKGQQPSMTYNASPGSALEEAKGFYQMGHSLLTFLTPRTQQTLFLQSIVIPRPFSWFSIIFYVLDQFSLKINPSQSCIHILRLTTAMYLREKNVHALPSHSNIGTTWRIWFLGFHGVRGHHSPICSSGFLVENQFLSHIV